MRRAVLAIALFAAFAGSATAASSAPSPTVFLLAGGGWGHGVGMSQWGAYGQAKAGRDYTQILAHYYRGTRLGAAPAPLERLRVLVATGIGAVSVSSTAPIVLVDGLGKRYRPTGPVTVEPKLELPVGKDGALATLPAPLTLRPTAGASLAYKGRSYHGELQLSKVAGRLQLVNTIALETYLPGVVAREMPKDWPLEALKAQAVAARTYAILHVASGKTFDLYSDWRSQLYQGVSADASGPAQAVKETRGQILTYDGKPAQTFYFSSSGGRTISSLDMFGSDLPYLVSVDDPWDETSPNHAWEPKLMSGSQLAKRFGLSDAVVDSTFVPGTPGKPAVVRFTTVTGGATDVRLSDVRGRLGLKSTGFRLGVLRLDRPVSPPQDGVLRLSGVARDVTGVVLEQRTAAGAWVTAKRLAPAPDGTFVVKVKHAATTVYRLAAAGLGGPPLTVRAVA
jgi:stage II sporulation protein D